MVPSDTPGVITERKKIPVAAMSMTMVAGRISMRSPRLARTKSWFRAMLPVTETAGSSPYRGESVKAWLVLKSGDRANAEEIVAFCRLHLASFKVPRQVEFRTELPKTMVGKYLRRVLVEEEKAKLAGRVEHETR